MSVLWSFYWNNKYVFTLENGKNRSLFKALLKTYISYGFTGIILNNILSWFWISVLSISILIYSIKTIFSEIKHLGRNLIKSRRLYLYGWHEKMVDLLFSVNYIVFMGICYMILMRICFSMVNIMNLGIAFCLTLVCIWAVGHSRSKLFRCINKKEFEV